MENLELLSNLKQQNCPPEVFQKKISLQISIAQYLNPENPGLILENKSFQDSLRQYVCQKYCSQQQKCLEGCFGYDHDSEVSNVDFMSFFERDYRYLQEKGVIDKKSA